MWEWVGWELPIEFDAVVVRRESATPSGELFLDVAQIDFIEGPCYADCDWSTGIGTLDFFDFLCVQNSFVLGEPYACDCDTSTGPGVCDLFDFLCFQNAFVAGCL